MGRQNLDYSIPAWLADIRLFLASVDAWALDFAWENRAELFPKKPPSSKEILADWYHPLLAFGKPEYDPLLKTKISNSAPVFLCAEGEESKKKGTIDQITAGSCCVPIINISKLWVMSGNRFGVTAVTQAVLLWPRQDKTVDDLGFVLDAQSLVRSDAKSPDIGLG